MDFVDQQTNGISFLVNKSGAAGFTPSPGRIPARRKASP
jgi:hypothetical protein